MKKFILVIVMTIESSKLCLAGVFTVTQYNLSIRPYSVTETKSYIAKESAWDGEPQTGTYTKVSFADLETNTDGNGNSCTPNFATVSFPGNIGGKHDWFAVEVKGFIKIPRPGWWSFACGSDDGFETTISGHGKSFTFAYDGHRWYATDVKPFYFEEAGVYKVQIVFFDYHINATLDFSMAEGYYTSFRSSIFHLAEAVDGVCTVSYNANCGTGTMVAQTFEEGKEQKLSKNTYRKDGYVFQGWAKSKSDADNGIVEYQDEEEITIESDMTLYAVWASPSLTLAAESADWSSGSITLRCADADTSGRTHTYTLQYYDESTDTWKDVSSAQSASASVSLPDTDFSSRLGGIPPVKYRVQDENGRVSVECVTRNKYGILVSPGGYAFGMGLSAYPSASPNYASVFGDLANGDKGKFTKVHVLTGSNAIYHEVDEAFADIGGKIKTGDVCFLYFGTHGGLHQSSTSSVLALYNGYYEEEQLANHIRLLNGVDAGHPNGNDVAIIGFVHACHSKGISDNSHDDAASGGYCQIGSWCVNSVLTSKNTAWITATDNSKALSRGDYFSLFLLDYGWGGGWALESGSGPLSCDKLAKYTKERTDAIFNGLIMKDDDNSYEVKVGVVDPSSILRNIYIGNCGSHSARNAPDNPCITVQGAVGSIAIEFSNIFDADRTILFKRKGEDGTWSGVYGENLTGTFSYADTDVESSGRECPYYYQLRTMNGAGVGVSNIESAWRIHMERHRISFYYDVPNGVNVASGGYYWDLPYDSTLNDIWGNLDEKIKGLGISGYIHTGWYTERNGKGRKISSDERVLVDVNYYADWTAMTQEWLDGHTQVAAVSGGDIATAAAMTAANGCRTVGECYALGINPEDPDDDFRIKSFKMDGTKPVVTVNHTEDGSGASLLPRMKMLGKAELSGEWEEVPEEGNPAHRFFTVTVEEP